MRCEITLIFCNGDDNVRLHTALRNRDMAVFGMCLSPGSAGGDRGCTRLFRAKKSRLVSGAALV
jgi:hypothetical protein